MDPLIASESATSQATENGRSAETNKTPEQVQEENKFQKAIAVWRGIDLANLIAKHDTTASDIVSHQRDSLVQRKDLAQKTKDFRKLDDASKLSEYKGLLKSYQAFIDLLTNQGKVASSSFLQFYTALSEAPDPYPLLEASIDSLVLSEDTVPKLNAEKDFLQNSVNRLTYQLEETEKRLAEERAARLKLEENQDKKIQEVEASWKAVLAEKTSNWEAKEKAFEEKAENHDRLLKELKASYEVSQRLDRSENAEGDTRSAATAAELEIVASDLERTSIRLAEVEARNEQLSLELAQAASQSQSEQSSRPVEEEPQYLRLQTENSSLMRKLEAARFDKDAERNTWEGKLRQCERASTKITLERDELREKLTKVADYDDIKRELEVIKSIEFSTGDDEPDTSVDDPKPSNSKENNLEQLLLARNKKLSNELTILRVSHQDLEGQLVALREELSRTNSELDKSRKLATKLENDLLHIQREATNSSAMSVAGTYVSRYPHGSRRGRVSPTSSIISGFDNAMSPTTMEAIRAGEPVGGGSGILPMVQAQRDRFKQKNSELEEELSKTYGIVKSLRAEVASLQKDNLGLYEKTRYVSTYNRGQASTSSTATPYSNRPNATAIQVDPDTPSGLSLDRYQSAYEAQISPFAAFRGRESARAYKRMSVPERIIFSITRMVLANRTSRNLFAAYCLALHIFLFIMLYSMSTTGIEKHAGIMLDHGAGQNLGAAGGGPLDPMD
ncbi:CASP [Nannizzia gypsea CBS 118893]|uniref:Protein CASP n=1 Tax=Arthroderma gypseum (strain ATCC MYA-4604 / CBS 118893) TaxID=535722 RepID=E4V207_ARTGP|nr:CASP [Nannizzia gypsea CBS 118893]EFR04072.1 CASP [Nannizzia gypsea CBS 118893]